MNSPDNKTIAAPDEPSILAFGAHPDDIEFGCGAIISLETRAGRRAHSVVCSMGEASTSGTPEIRAEETRKASHLLGATVEFLELDGDSHLEIKSAHVIKLAEIIRRIRPGIVLAPSCHVNQHPDHWRLGQMVRDAARLARYGGLKELLELQAHSVDQLFFYAVTPDGEPPDIDPIYVDISAPEVHVAWTAAMNAHVSQSATRNYVELQTTRARLLGARAGVEYAMALYPNDPLILKSLAQAGKGARRF
ncbi:MAG TPA: PIG-L family deacetylase [Chroococcales cyanobacterium]